MPEEKPKKTSTVKSKNVVDEVTDGDVSTPDVVPEEVADKVEEAVSDHADSSGSDLPEKDDVAAKVADSASKIAASAAAGTNAAMKGLTKAAQNYDLKNSYKLAALISAVATGVWMLWPQFGELTFWSLGLWWIFVVAGAVLVFAPLLKTFTKMEEATAGQCVVVGALMLAFAWFFLARQDIPSNASFFATIAAASAIFAAWKAPGRPKLRSER